MLSGSESRLLFTEFAFRSSSLGWAAGLVEWLHGIIAQISRKVTEESSSGVLAG
jgi:hypothetical protein